MLITDNQYTDEMLTYHSGDSIFIQVNDQGQNTTWNSRDVLTVDVWSEREATHEILSLNETGTSTGIFRGYIPLDAAAGTPASDGQLQVDHGDWMYFRYIDPANDWGNVDTLFKELLFNATVFVGGYIESNTTFPLQTSPFIISGDVYIRNNAILTIEPGVEIYITPDRDDAKLGIGSGLDTSRVDIYVDSGKLNSIGTSIDSILSLLQYSKIVVFSLIMQADIMGSNS